MISSKQIAKELFKESKKTNDLSLFVDNFMQYLKSKKLEYIIPSVLKHLEIIEKREKDLLTAKISFGKEPTDETVKMVKNHIKLGEKDTDVVVDVEKDLIGGFVAEYNGVIYDGSLKGYIRGLEKALLQI